MAPYPSFSPKGKKLGHCASPPFPTEPSRAAVSSFAALRMRHTPCGYCAGLRRGPNWGAQQHRRKSSLGGLTAGEDGRCGAGTPPALCATSPYRGGKKFPLKGGCPEGRGCLRAMDHRPYRENPSVSTADSSPYRGAFERPHLSDALKFPLQGGMSRSDKGVNGGT